MFSIWPDFGPILYGDLGHFAFEMHTRGDSQSFVLTGLALKSGIHSRLYASLFFLLVRLMMRECAHAVFIDPFRLAC